MLQDFKQFIARGNVLDLAVGVIIGGAFGTIVTSLTEDLIMPVISMVSGKADFNQWYLRLGEIPAELVGKPVDYAALKAAGVPMLGYGAFITALINFLIIAFAIFLIVRAANKILRREEPAPAGPSEEVLLLREIRDNLKK